MFIFVTRIHTCELSDIRILLLERYHLTILQEGHKVSLNVYDLSQGMARQFSMTLLGKPIEGIW